MKSARKCLHPSWIAVCNAWINKSPSDRSQLEQQHYGFPLPAPERGRQRIHLHGRHAVVVADVADVGDAGVQHISQQKQEVSLP